MALKEKDYFPVAKKKPLSYLAHHHFLKFEYSCNNDLAEHHQERNPASDCNQVL